MADLKSRNSRNTNPKPSPASSASRKNSGKPKRRNIFKQMKMIYDFTKKEDPSVTWWMLGGFIIPAALIVGLGFILRNGWIGWILNIITALLLGFLVMTVILTNRSEAAGYKRLEGQPGAAGAVLDSLSSGRFTGRVIQFTKEPVWVDPRTKNAIWRGTSLYGVYLVAEGHGDGQVPLSKLRRHLRKRHKIKFTMDELEHVNDRLRTLQSKNGLPIPKGVDPARMKKVSRRAMRGK